MPTALCGSVQGRQGPEPSVAVRMPAPGEDSQAASPLLAALPGRHRPERRAPSPSARILGTAMGESLASPQTLRAFPGSRPFSVPRFQPKLHLALSDGQADAPQHELLSLVPVALPGRRHGSRHDAHPPRAGLCCISPRRPSSVHAGSAGCGTAPAPSGTRSAHGPKGGFTRLHFHGAAQGARSPADAIPSPCPTSWHREQLSHVTPV